MTKATFSSVPKQPPRHAGGWDTNKVALATVYPKIKAAMERACACGARVEAAVRAGHARAENAERNSAWIELQQAVLSSRLAVSYGSPFPRFMSRVLQPVPFQQGDES